MNVWGGLPTDSRLRDAYRGAMWEQKWRDTLEEYPTPWDLAERANELLQIPEPAPQTIDGDWPDKRVGVGTYQWKYSHDVIEAALENGAAMIDTAETYGYGKVETELGKVLANWAGRLQDSNAWIATKCGRHRLSFNSIVNAAERSRERLQIPVIDLYQIHWPNPLAPVERTMEAMAKLIEMGVIRRVGVSNFSAPHLCAAIEAARAVGIRVYSNQIRLNQLDAEALAYLIPYCESVGVRVIAYSPFAQGRLAKRGDQALSWILDQPIDMCLPRTNNVQRMVANLRERELVE